MAGGVASAWHEQQAVLLAISALGLLVLAMMRTLRAATCPGCGSADIERRVLRYLTLVGAPATSGGGSRA